MSKPIKQMLRDGEEVRVMMVGPIAHPKVIEIVGIMGGLHGLWIDQEHSAVTQREIEVLMLACRSAGLEGFVRVPPLDYTTIMRPMEAGAFGIMTAQIRNVEEVRRIVDWAKSPPVGSRGMFRGNYEAAYCASDLAEHVERCNRDRWLAIQIETTEAVDCADEIAAVDGVDSLFVGPGDLAAAFGVPGESMHPRCVTALEKVSAAAKKAGKSWGVLPTSIEHARKCRELGCQMFSLTSEIEMLRAGMTAMRQTYDELF